MKKKRQMLIRYWLIAIIGCVIYSNIFICETGAESMEISEMSDQLMNADKQIENVIKVDTSQKGIEISPMLYGVFFEDINSAADGGLYGELLQNRSFEIPGRRLRGWGIIQENNSGVKYAIEDTWPLSKKNPHYLQIKIEEPDAGVQVINYGYNGISVKANEKYVFSIFARSPTDSIRALQITIEDERGIVSGGTEIKGISAEWKRFEASILCDTQLSEAFLVMRIWQEGTLDMDMVSLFPEKTWKNRKNGLRYDLAELLSDLRPAFFRFPGGCVVEGRTMANAYRWKATIGDISERPTMENLWGYYQSHGLGFYEFFQFCEDIGAEPLPVVNCGMACQARNGGMAALNDLDEYIREALDLIEFANGSVNTKMGAIRAELGHPAPFNLQYLAIGNEQWGPEYYVRFERFYDAIKSKYPEIKLIFAAGPSASGRLFDDAWKWIKGRRKGDIVDEHYYLPPEWYLSNVHRYDEYDRNGPQVFVGEYAAHGLGRRNDWESALSEAAYLLGLERNSDIVVMASYAPLFSKERASQWAPTLIKFNNDTSFATPNYYVQQVFNANLGRYMLPTVLKTTASYSQNNGIKGMIGVGSWLTKVEYKEVKVISKDGKVIYEDDFHKNTRDEWIICKGVWGSENGVFAQSSLAENCYAITGDPNWSDYTISVKAKKVLGNEGFLIMFGVKDTQNFYWWNIGGWGNTTSAIEKSVNGMKHNIGDSMDIKIASGEWLDIQIRITGERIRCYLNGNLLHDVTDRRRKEEIIVNSAIDTNGDIILKVVNTTDQKQRFEIILDGLGDKDIPREGEVTILAAERLNEENTFNEPQKIFPISKKAPGIKEKFFYEFEKLSVTVLRIKSAK